MIHMMFIIIYRYKEKHLKDLFLKKRFTTHIISREEPKAVLESD